MLSIIKRTSLPFTSTAGRFFSVTSFKLSEGAPSGKSSDAFSKREKSEEERYIRAAEAEKIAALRKSIEESKKHLDKLEKDHHAQEKKH